MSTKQNSLRKRKRKPPVNRHSKYPSSSTDIEKVCASENKIKLDHYSELADESDDDDFFMMINFSIMKHMFAPLLHCPICHVDNITVVDNRGKRMGFAHNLKISCLACAWSKTIYTSKECGKKERQEVQGRNLFEVNARAVIGFREIGCGISAMQTFSKCMNLNSLSKKAFNNLNHNHIYKAYEKAATNSMKRAADNLQSPNIDGPTQKRIKIDGAWQRRGYSSLNGVITGIVDNHVVDIVALSKTCKGCQMWAKRKGTHEYDRWKAEHICNLNHTKSSGSMESIGAVTMFKRSIEKNNLVYHEYLGDGDTSSYKDVIDADPYKDINIMPVKLECIGHVQKRLGTRLRNLVKSYKGTKTPIGGRGKLTESIINSMQNYYGLAIRNNTTSLYAMKKAVGSVLNHCTAFPDENLSRHGMCPRDKDTWCKYQLSKLNGNSSYKSSKVNIPVSIHNLLKPTFKDLSDDTLLSKCLHGETQNTNEAFNGVVWSRCPKRVFINKRTFEIGINSAVLHYNDGEKGLLEVLSYFGLSGSITVHNSAKRDKNRISRMKRKSGQKDRTQRKNLRSIKKGYLDEEKLAEKTESYSAGAF